jgi:aspartate/methionine/tyrosine aminotransferase
VIGPGSKSLIWALFLALGEELILTQPSWVSYAPQSHLLAKPVTWVPTRPETGYRIEMDVLEDVVDEARNGLGNPEVLVINSPMNPTGTMIPPDSLREIADFARSHEMVLISDEIYALTVHEDLKHESIACHYPEGSIVLGGLSKNLSMGGWRFGLAILPPGPGGQALRRALQTLATNTWTCVTAPVQYAALAAYAEDPEIDDYIDTCSAMHTIRTCYLYDTMVRLGVPCAEPQGGFYIFPSFERWQEPLAAKGIDTDVDLAMYLLDHYEIATLPGSDFNSAQPFCLRVSSSYIDAATDDAAESLLEAYRADPDPVRFIEDHHPRLHRAVERLEEFVNELEGR